MTLRVFPPKRGLLSGSACWATLFLFTSLCCGQVTTGSFSGTVTDASGAVIAGASVTVRNEATGVETKLTTNQTGFFKAPFLEPGRYALRVENSGFRVFESRNLEVALSKETVQNVTLEVGATAETVTVEGGAVIIETSTAQLSLNVESKRVMTLPRMVAGLDRLALLSPGVVPGFGNINSNGAVFSANGQRARSNNFLLDGSDNNDSTIAGPGFFFSNVEAVGEFQVITNQFSAEYGRNQGAILNIVTRGGNNDLHGSAVWAHENDKPLASLTNFQRRAGVKEPPKRIHNVFGGTVGGPIKKDKVFFHGYLYRTITKRDTRLEATASNMTPTPNGLATLRQNFPNSSSVRALLDHGPVSRAIGDPVFLPDTRVDNVRNPAGGTVGVEMGRLVRTYSNPFKNWEFGTREDFNLSDKDRINARYLYRNAITENSGANLGGYFWDVPAKSINAGATWTRVLKPTLVNEFRFSFVRLQVNFEGNNTFKFNEIGKNIANFSLPPGYLGFGLPTNIPQFRDVKRFQFQDNISWQRGSHAIKMGVQIARDHIPAGFLPQVNGQFTFNTLQDFVDNRPAFFNGAAGEKIIAPTQIDQFYFFQDDIRIKPNLTLNLGVRYEYSGQPMNILNDITTARESNASTALWNTNLPLADRTVQYLRPDRNNLAPRFGFAYTPRFWKGLFGDEATVIRGGYSIAYDAQFYNLMLNISTSTPVVLLYQLAGSGMPVPADVTGDNLAKLATPPRGGDPRRLNQTQFTPDLHSPYSQNWSLGFQRRAGRNQGFEVRYVGTRAIGQFQTINGNPLVSAYIDNGFGSVIPSGIRPTVNPGCAACAGRVIPDYGNIRVRSNDAMATYHGLQTRYDGRLFHQLVLGTSYTYAKSIDNVSEVFNFTGSGSIAFAQNPFDIHKGERGLSNNDIKHAWSTNFVWDTPWFKDQRGFLGRVLGGWTMSGVQLWYSGRPMQPLQSNSQAPSVTDRSFNVTFAGAFDTLRPFSSNPNAPLRSTGIYLPNGNLVDFNNRTQTVTPDQVRWIFNNLDGARRVGVPFGAGRGVLRGPKTYEADFALFKNIKIREKVSAQLRLESSNIFNHPVLSIPNLYIDVANNRTFLNETETQSSPRIFTIGMRLFF